MSRALALALPLSSEVEFFRKLFSRAASVQRESGLSR
jgi:hypothetical protein